jgi:hypothetical protein
MYVNHRPVFHVGKDDIRDAFKTLVASNAHAHGSDSATLARDQLLSRLQQSGEKMSEKELIVCFQALLGDGAAANLLSALPTTFMADNFAMDLLGFEDYERSAAHGDAATQAAASE